MKTLLALMMIVGSAPAATDVASLRAQVTMLQRQLETQAPLIAALRKQVADLKRAAAEEHLALARAQAALRDAEKRIAMLSGRPPAGVATSRTVIHVEATKPMRGPLKVGSIGIVVQLYAPKRVSKDSCLGEIAIDSYRIEDVYQGGVKISERKVRVMVRVPVLIRKFPVPLSAWDYIAEQIAKPPRRRPYIPALGIGRALQVVEVVTEIYRGKAQAVWVLEPFSPPVGVPTP